MDKNGVLQDECNKAMEVHIADFSIDNVLRSLILESDLMDVVGCLDMIAQEDKNRVLMHGPDGGRIYPAPGVPVVLGSVIDFAQELEPVSDKYKGGFFKGRHRLNWRVPIVCDAIMEVFDIKPPEQSLRIQSVVDAGCAIGEFVAEFLSRGIAAWGIEGSEAAAEFAVTTCMSCYDLRVPFPSPLPLARKYKPNDLCISLEVAEHIEEKYADVYLDNLCQLSDTILITAAQPGQDGFGHVNCQHKDYWIQKMLDRDYQCHTELADAFAYFIKQRTNRRELLCYANNAMVFKKLKREEI